MTTITYVIPAYNEAETLPKTVALLVDRLATMPGSEIVIVENGSRDDTAEVAARLAAATSTPAVRVVADHSEKGLANALRRGIGVAECDWVCCTAADLPFGFTDLDAFLAADPQGGIAIGSKAHRGSVVERSLLRRLMTAVFRVSRLAVLGMRVGDPQGSLFVERELAQRLGQRTTDAGFLFGTELVALAHVEGAPIVELPVVLEPLRGGSTVRPVQDSLKMLAGLFELRRRLRREAADAARAATLAAPATPVVAATARRVAAPLGVVLAIALALVLGIAGVVVVPAYVAFATYEADAIRDGGGFGASHPRVLGILLLLAGAAVAAAGAGALSVLRRRRAAR